MSKNLWQKSLWNSFISRFSLRSHRQSRRRSQLTRFGGHSVAAAESLETRIVPALNVSFAGSTLTLAGPVGTDQIKVVELATSTQVYVGPTGSTLIATLNSANNTNITNIVVTGAATTNSLTVIGNAAALTTIDLQNAGKLTVNGANGANVAVNSDNATSLTFGPSSISGNLTVTADGVVTQSGALNVTGIASFTTTAASNISLSNAGNGFGTLALSTTGAATITEGNATNLAASSVNSLALTSGGSVSQTGAIVSGVTSVTAAGDIVLGGANNFGALTLVGGSITLNEAAAGADVTFASVTARGSLTATAAAGSISQTGVLSVVGRGTFTATGGANDVLLGLANAFGSISATAPDQVTINETSAIDLAFISAGGALAVTSATGAINDTGMVSVGGATTLSAVGNPIALDTTTNDFVGTVQFTGSNVTLVDAAGGIQLGSGAGNSVATGTLTVTATRPAGAIPVAPVTDTGVLLITGKATFNAVGNGTSADFQDITLNDATGQFGSLALKGANVIVSESGSTDLANCTITGALFTVTSTGAITNGTVGNNSTIAADAAVTTFTAPGGISVLTAAQVVSTFGTLNLNSTAGNVSITEGWGTVLAGVSVPAGSFTLNAIDGGTTATPASRTVTQTGTIVVSGVATINASSAFDVTLPLANEFGSLGLTGRNVTVNEVFVAAAAGTLLNNSTIYGNLNLTTVGGDLTQVAGSVGFQRLSVAGTATLSAPNITLTRQDPISLLGGAPIENASNLFGTLFLTSAGNVSIFEKGATDIGATGGSIGGTLTIGSTGLITDSGVVQVTGATTLAAVAYATAPAAVSPLVGTPANGILLNSNDNAFVPVPTDVFTGALNLRSTNVNVWNLGPTNLGVVTATGNLNVTTTGSVTNAVGLVNVTGTATFTKSGAAAGVDVTLGTGTPSTLGTIALNGQTSNFEDLTLTEGDATNFAATTLTGNLSVTSAGNVTDSGVLSVTGTTTIQTNGSITFDTPANNFVGDFNFAGQAGGVTASGAVSIVDSAGNIQFAASQGSTLTVIAVGGAVTDSGTLIIGAGTGAVTITALGNLITLDDATNQYGILTLKGSNVTVAEAAASSPLTLGNSTASGFMKVTTAGSVNQAPGSTLVVAGTLTIDPIDVTLTNSGNRFGLLVMTATGNAAVIESDAIVLGAINVTGTLSLTAAGTITQQSPVDITVGGAATLTATGNDITLNTATNSFGSVTFTGKNVSITEDNAAVAGTAIGGTALGNLTVNAAGAVTNNGALLIGGRATFVAPSVDLSGASNSFGSIAVTGALNLTIVEGNATDLFTTTLTGFLSVTSGGAITDSGVITVGTTTTLVAGLGAAAITLDSAGNDFIGLVDFSGSNVTLVDINAIDFNASEATSHAATLTSPAEAGNLTVTSGGNVTQTGGRLSVSGTTTINTSNDAITLSNGGNLFGGSVLLKGGAGGSNVTLTDSSGDLTLGTSTIGTAAIFSVTSTGGQVWQDPMAGGGTVTAGDTTIVANTAGGSAITLTNANNVFGTLTLTSNNNIAIREADSILVNTVSANAGAGTLSLTSTATPALATAGITQVAATTITAGNTTLVASGSNKIISLTTNANVFGNLAITGGNVDIHETGGTSFALSNISGTLSVTSNGGAITDVGMVGAPVAVTVSGTTTLIAGGGLITLDSPNSTFGTLVLSTTTNASVTDAGPVDLGTSTIGGNLAIIYGGNVTDSGVVTVTGMTSILALTPPGNRYAVTLDQPAALTGAVSLFGNNVLLTNSIATDLGSVDASGTLTVTANAGAITQSTSIKVIGVASFTAPAGVDLSISANTLTTVKFTVSAGNVAILATDDLDLGASVISGNLDITTGFLSGGNITDSGTLTISGTTALTAGFLVNASITLDQALSTFGPNVIATADLILTGSNIYVKDNGPVLLGNVTANGTLTIVSGLGLTHSIIQTVASVITTNFPASAALFNAGAGAVNLPNANVFAGLKSGIGGLGVNIQP
ncbi:MAG: hypothetical protein NT013_25190 [Planctomycetia bacterium]|nr:hypothetical protein [Planctomycetia bacterium]